MYTGSALAHPERLTQRQQVKILNLDLTDQFAV